MPGQRFPRFTAPRTPAPPNPGTVVPGTVTVSTVSNTVSIAGTVTSSITGSITVSSITNTVTVTGSVTVIGGTITGTFGAGGTATAADPSYGEGTTGALSLNLSGYLRAVLSSASIISSITNPITANPTTSAGFTTSQVTITSTVTATQIFASGASTIFREVTNPTASNATIFLGASGVSTTSGHYCVGGSAVDWNNNSAAIFAVTATGSVTVSTMGW